MQKKPSSAVKTHKKTKTETALKNSELKKETRPKSAKKISVSKAKDAKDPTTPL